MVQWICPWQGQLSSVRRFELFKLFARDVEKPAASVVRARRVARLLVKRLHPSARWVIPRTVSLISSPLAPPRTGRMPEARIRSKLPNRTWIALITLPAG
jgi:hypothetical protein